MSVTPLRYRHGHTSSPLPRSRATTKWSLISKQEGGEPMTEDATRSSDSRHETRPRTRQVAAPGAGRVLELRRLTESSHLRRPRRPRSNPSARARVAPCSRTARRTDRQRARAARGCIGRRRAQRRGRLLTPHRRDTAPHAGQTPRTPFRVAETSSAARDPRDQPFRASAESAGVVATIRLETASSPQTRPAATGRTPIEEPGTCS